MNYILKYEDVSSYLFASKYVDFDNSIIQDKKVSVMQSQCY